MASEETTITFTVKWPFWVQPSMWLFGTCCAIARALGVSEARCERAADGFAGWLVDRTIKIA